MLPPKVKPVNQQPQVKKLEQSSPNHDGPPNQQDVDPTTLSQQEEQKQNEPEESTTEPSKKKVEGGLIEREAWKEIQQGMKGKIGKPKGDKNPDNENLVDAGYSIAGEADAEGGLKAEEGKGGKKVDGKKKSKL